MKRYFFKTRCAAIMFIAAGYGWADGHYIPANSSILLYVLQFIIISVFLVMCIKFLTIPEKDRLKSNWSVTGLSIFSIISLLINVLDIIHGAYSSHINSFGSHNTFADLVPLALLIIGNSLWIITIIKNVKPGDKEKYLWHNQYNIL
jgi:NADH:ubiquinone oxidoreductase subunit 6 (subunit J)